MIGTMTDTNNDKALEAYKIFPYVAWGLVIIFAIFVYNITSDLKQVTRDLQAQANYIQQKIDTPVDKITDFENLESEEAPQ